MIVGDADPVYPTEKFSIGIDIGGTKTLGGVVNSAGEIIHKIQIPTPKQKPILALTHMVKQLQAHCSNERNTQGRESQITAIGCGIAGFINYDTAQVLFSAHLKDAYRNIYEELTAALNLPVSIDNDANTAAYAEKIIGAAQPYEECLVINLGTGIGGAIISGGQLARGHHGISGEFGHMIVDPQGKPCECGQNGCWEQYCSGSSLQKEIQDDLDNRILATSEIRTRSKKTAQPINGTLLAQAAAAGDPYSQEKITHIAYWLARGIANIAHVLNPEACIIGGGLSQAGAPLIAAAQSQLDSLLSYSTTFARLPLLKSQIGPESGMIGAALQAQHHMKTDTHFPK